jgi:hypothetical protein
MFENPNKTYISEFNNPIGQKFFKECVPDLYSIEDKEAFFLMDVIFMAIMKTVR